VSALNLNSVFFTDANTGYIVGENGTILKTTNGGGSVSAARTQTIESTITIYPNPATNKISIATNNNLQGETTICIFNMNGALLQQKIFQSQNLIELDVSTLPKGFYLVKIQSNKGIETKKLVVQ
ncbi:MAG: T9SS type A sorting domain-containing protein, partial [Alphaproteobacteria bacterium]|nr:T9SS type A sorting domain-containing protein [Alphaproteobacteria bacterium]